MINKNLMIQNISGNLFYGKNIVNCEQFIRVYNDNLANDYPFDFRQIKADSFGLTDFYTKAINALYNEYGEKPIIELIGLLGGGSKQIFIP